MFAIFSRTPTRIASVREQLHLLLCRPVWLERYGYSFLDFFALGVLMTLTLLLLESADIAKLVRLPVFWGSIPLALSITAYLLDDVAARFRDSIVLSDSPERLRKSAFCEVAFFLFALSGLLPLLFAPGISFSTLGRAQVTWMLGGVLTSVSVGAIIATSAYTQIKLAGQRDRILSPIDFAALTHYAVRRGRGPALQEALTAAGGDLNYTQVQSVIAKLRAR